MKQCEIKKFTANDRSGKWWEELDKKKDGSKKWSTMQHNGVLFPPAYEPLPKDVRVLYEGKPVKLDATNTNNKFHITAEEAAVFFAMKLEQDDRLSAKNPKRKRVLDDKVFMSNFWKDWKVILGSSHPIKSIKDVDFTPIQKYIVARSEQKKASKKKMSKEEKAEEKKEKEAVKDLYGYAVVDGVKIALGNYMVQPPGLFIGHGNQPLRGGIKKRIQPSDVTINVSKNSVPKCHWVCADDMEKFDKARKLAENIEEVRKAYTKDLKSSKPNIRQLATAVYLLDVLAVRPGTEKDEKKESDTLGLTTLKCDNIKFEAGNYITINFVGKSSIEFSKRFKVDSSVYSNLQGSCKGEKKTAKLFPEINSTTLNGYLKTLLPGLTAKVFRTYKAGITLQKELDKNMPDPSMPTHEKKLLYDRANMLVAVALNHKNLTESGDKIKKLKEKIKEIKEKMKKANTEKQKETAQKSLDLNEAKLEQAEGNISLSTSKVNYIDSRITVAWCKKAEMPIEKIYNKSQLKKFVWAMDTPMEWKF